DARGRTAGRFDRTKHRRPRSRTGGPGGLLRRIETPVADVGGCCGPGGGGRSRLRRLRLIGPLPHCCNTSFPPAHTFTALRDEGLVTTAPALGVFSQDRGTVAPCLPCPPSSGCPLSAKTPYGCGHEGKRAIALGHPYGAGGAILVTRVHARLARQQIGGAHGTAVAMTATAGGLGVSSLFTGMDQVS